MRRLLAKIVFRARVNVPDAKNWNSSPSITILMGFLRILVFCEMCLVVDVYAQKREISDF